ncbi:hypothetical protein VNO77_42118 [Canavalia gladiata]|uniref:Uncharacterized protein n=1 Tax=Canavalia gladiata TaxID=3824 RepID=A0AAN9PQQ6_CANGL
MYTAGEIKELWEAKFGLCSPLSAARSHPKYRSKWEKLWEKLSESSLALMQEEQVECVVSLVRAWLGLGAGHGSANCESKREGWTRPKKEEGHEECLQETIQGPLAWRHGYEYMEREMPHHFDALCDKNIGLFFH